VNKLGLTFLYNAYKRFFIFQRCYVLYIPERFSRPY